MTHTVASLINTMGKFQRETFFGYFSRASFQKFIEPRADFENISCTRDTTNPDEKSSWYMHVTLLHINCESSLFFLALDDLAYTEYSYIFVNICIMASNNGFNTKLHCELSLE